MKNYTDIEQSKKLTEFLPLESSDHHYVRKVCDYMGNAVDGEWSWPKYGNIDSKYANYIVQNFTSYEKIPCWSLAALLSILKPINGNTYTIYGTLDGGAMITFEEVTCAFHEKEIIDAVYRMVLWLNEQNML